VDEQGKPTAAPPLSLDNEIQKRRFEEAQTRRNMRLNLYKLREHK
jgi:acyl-CoA hydrolase